MTVCVATMFGRTKTQGASIIGACDRLLSNSSFQIAPSTKIHFSDDRSLVFMVAGDPGLAKEILNGMAEEGTRWQEANPKSLWPFSAVADAYRSAYADVRRKTVEAHYLKHLGLTSASFVEQNRSLSPELMRSLREDMDSHPMPEVALLIAGFDAWGPHILTADGLTVTVNDSQACGAIGSGAFHALSELANAEHTIHASRAAALISTLAAKKRAELAPTVGRATDMFMIGPVPGSYQALSNQEVRELEGIYETWANREAVARSSAIEDTENYLSSLVAKLPAQPETGASSKED